MLEHDEDERAMYAYALVAMGFDIMTARDGAHAHVGSADAVPSVRQRAEHARCAAFCLKPYLPDALAIRLRGLVGQVPNRS